MNGNQSHLLFPTRPTRILYFLPAQNMHNVQRLRKLQWHEPSVHHVQRILEPTPTHKNRHT